MDASRPRLGLWHPGPSPRQGEKWWTALAPAVDIEGPRVRMGLLWAGVSMLALAAGPVVASVVFAAVAVGAAGQACRSWRGMPRTPYRPVAAFGAAACALGAGAGPAAVGAATVLTAVAALTAQQLRFGRRSWDARLTLAIALVAGVAAASPVVVRERLGTTPAMVLLALVHVVDASTFIVNSGTSSRWEGRAAGAASAAAVALAVAAVLVPPFRGASPWLLAGLTAALVPVGTLAASAVLGRMEAPAPALRRLDALFIAGPVWALVASMVLDL